MAVRPLVTTGVALLSAGALVAGTPALFVPHSEVTVAAPAAAVAPSKLTVEQIRLLAAATTLADAFFTGHGGLVTSGEDAVILDGFAGAAYWIVDQLVPDIDVRPGDDANRPIDQVFFEEGFTGVAHDVSGRVADEIDSIDPTGGQLDLATRVDDFFNGGVTLLVQHLIDDNLPENAVGDLAKGLNDAFFDGGVVGAVTYVLQVLGVVSVPQDEAADALVAENATLKTSSPSSTGLPEAGSLLKLPKFESPFKKLSEQFQAPATVDPAEGETEGTPEATEQVDKKTKPGFNIVKDNPLSSVADKLSVGKPTGKGGGAFAKGETNGQKFVKQATENLQKAFKPAKHESEDGGADAGKKGDGDSK